MAAKLLVQTAFNNAKSRVHVRCSALQLTSWKMCQANESIEDKLQRTISGYLAAETVMSLLHTPDWQLLRTKSHM